MMRFFVDTSVLFSAFYSSKGASARLVDDAIAERVELVISEDIANELREAFVEKAPHLLPLLERLLALVPFVYVAVTQQQRDQAVSVVSDPDDAHVVAAANLSQAQALVSLDKKHLLGKPAIAEYLGFEVITPGQALAQYK